MMRGPIGPVLARRQHSGGFGGTRLSAPAVVDRSRRRVRVAFRTVAELQARGIKHRPEDITVKKIIGEGSFGQVFEGLLSTRGGTERVILKRVKARVEGAAEMCQMEHLLNVYAAKVAKKNVADFMGYLEVEDHEATRNLTPGLWLIWRHEGLNTLQYYIKRRDCLKVLSKDLGVPEDCAVPVVMQQICEALLSLHNAGLVHRDVKPPNIIFAESERRFKLVDLGACADLRSGTNYVPDESILDPIYCPPEQYVMPTDSPHLAKTVSPLAMVMSPVLWSRHKPDRFDSYSAGLCMMQLCVPRLRTTNGLKNFNTAMARYNYDLQEWRESARLPARETALLDADDEAGWELATSLLRPRRVTVDSGGRVSFENSGGTSRISAHEALKHKFVRLGLERAAAAALAERGAGSTKGSAKGSTRGSVRMARSDMPASVLGTVQSQVEEEEEAAAAAAAAAAKPKRFGGFNVGVKVWKQATERLFDLEAKIRRQAEAADYQTTTVKKLQQEVAQGRASARELELAQNKLSHMKGRLSSMMDEFGNTAGSATRMVGSFLGSTGSAKSRAGSPPPPAARAAAALPAPPKSPSQKWQPGWQPRGKAGVEEEEELMEEPQREPEAAGPSGRELAGSAASAATNVIYAGLKFTGLALRVATDMANALGKDAEKRMKEGTTTAKVSKEESRAFMQLLREANPPLDPRCKWEEVRPRLVGDPRIDSLPPEQCALMFAVFIEALAKVEEASQASARTSFLALIEEANFPPTTTWDQAAAMPKINSDPSFLALPSDIERRRLFNEYKARMRAAAEEVAAAQDAETAFKGLLETCQPPVTASSPWPLIKRQIWSDPRYTAVPERRRRHIFEEFTELLAELEGYQAQQGGGGVAEAASLAWEGASAAVTTPQRAAVPLHEDNSSAAAVDALAWLEASASFSEDEDEMPAASAEAGMEEVVDAAEAAELEARAAFVALQIEVLEQAESGAGDEESGAPGAEAEPEDITQALAELEAMYSFTLKIDRKKLRPPGVREPFVLTTYEAEVPAGAIAAAAFAEEATPEEAAEAAALQQRQAEAEQLAVAARDGSDASALDEAPEAVSETEPITLPAQDAPMEEPALVHAAVVHAAVQAASPSASQPEAAVDVDDLRVQQALLKAEYERMQRQLEEMEGRLRAKEQAMGPLEPEKAVATPENGSEANGGSSGNGVGSAPSEVQEEAQVSTDPDGYLVFSFRDERGSYGEKRGKKMSLNGSTPVRGWK